MRMIPFECPNCGAQLSVAEGKTRMRCGWCNSDIEIKPDGDGVRANVNVNINVNVERDEARLREADMADIADRRRHDVELFKTKLRFGVPVAMMLVGGAVILLRSFLGAFAGLAGAWLIMFGVVIFANNYSNGK